MPSLSFAYPQLLILLLLMPLVWRYMTNRRRTVSAILRLAIACLAGLAMAGPRLALRQPDSDLIVLVDRSASCGDAAGRMLREITPILRKGGEAGDRLAVIAFGDGAELEQSFDDEAGGGAQSETFDQASDLAAALQLADAVRSPGRRTALLCLSDGLATGRDPREFADVGGAPFWYRRLGHAGLDAAAGDISLPEQAEPRSAWLVKYSIQANAPCEAEYALTRNGVALAGGTVKLKRGENHFFARDTADAEGMLEYRLQVRLAGDAVRQNNMSRALLSVRGAPKILVVAPDRKAGLVAAALTSAAIPVDIVAPGEFPVTPAMLSPYKLVILENSPVSSFPGQGAAALAGAVESGLVSLLVTGGPNSFGMGGYHRSPLDPLLPVEMELRNEKRRGTMAVAIALDRSGSMDMPAGGGRTKMDLANLGAAESIRLLSPGDQVAVLAVDTAAHTIVPLSRVDSAENLAKTVLGIQSLGGGIFCRTAIEAAAKELDKSNLANRHIILFADASDAEEQEDCFRLAAQLAGRGIKLSVIAMGTPTDSDAGFLLDLALEGEGESLFSDNAGNLPALFTQEIMRISRRGFLEERVRPRLLGALSGLGVGPDQPSFDLGGFNVAAAREGATVLMNLDDEFSSPIAAIRAGGKAMTGALLFEADGEFSGTFPAWRSAPDLLVALARRLAGGVNLAEVKAYAGFRSGEAEARFEFSSAAAETLRKRKAEVEWMGPGGRVSSAPLEWVEPTVAEARTALSGPGHYLAIADLGELGRAASPPVSLSYSGEFSLRPESAGANLLAELAELTGGGDGADVTRVRRSAVAERSAGRDMGPLLLVLVILLFLFELSGRRLLWFR